MIDKIQNAYQRYVEWNFKRTHPPVSDLEKTVLMMFVARTEDTAEQEGYRGLSEEFSKLDGSPEAYQCFLDKITWLSLVKQDAYQAVLDDFFQLDRDERHGMITLLRYEVGLPVRGLDERAILIGFFILMAIAVLFWLLRR